MTEQVTRFGTSTELVDAGSLVVLPGNRTESGRFQKGHSGNPNGRPKSAGLAALVKEKTRDGVELVDVALSILRSKRQDPKYRLQALEWLADRGWGRPIQSHELMGDGGGAVVFTLRLGERDDHRDD